MDLHENNDLVRPDLSKASGERVTPPMMFRSCSYSAAVLRRGAQPVSLFTRGRADARTAAVVNRGRGRRARAGHPSGVHILGLGVGAATAVRSKPCACEEFHAVFFTGVQNSATRSEFSSAFGCLFCVIKSFGEALFLHACLTAVLRGANCISRLD